MRPNHVTVPVLVVMVTALGVVSGQVDMFSLHDSQRGDVSMHVTRESAQIEAIADSVSLEMNPQGAPGAGFARSLGNNTHGGYTIGNIDQSQISMKEDTAKTTKANTATDRSEVTSRDNHVVDHVAERTNQIAPLPILSLPHSNRLIHVAQDDFNVRRSQLPGAHAHKRSLRKRKGRKYKRHSRPRPTCNDDVTAVKKSIKGDRFDILGDFTEIMEKSVKRKRSNRRSKRSSVRGKHHEKRSVGDTRREGELYNIHDGVLSPVMESKSCISTTHEEESKNSARSEISSSRETRAVPEEQSERVKKSGVKTMKIHNELGGMHIKSNPGVTAVTSESGNLEITMLNDQGSSSVKKDETGAVRKLMIKTSQSSQSSQSSHQYDKASVRTLHQSGAENSLRPKLRLHLAQDVSLKRSDVFMRNGHPVLVM